LHLVQRTHPSNEREAVSRERAQAHRQSSGGNQGEGVLGKGPDTGGEGKDAGAEDVLDWGWKGREGRREGGRAGERLVIRENNYKDDKS
jgi:hypothetical protein